MTDPKFSSTNIEANRDFEHIQSLPDGSDLHIKVGVSDALLTHIASGDTLYLTMVNFMSDPFSGRSISGAFAQSDDDAFITIEQIKQMIAGLFTENNSVEGVGNV